MSDEKNKFVPLREGFEGASKLKPQGNLRDNSLAGADSLRPGNVPLEKGLEGAGNLKPQQPQQSGGGSSSGGNSGGSSGGDKKD